MPQNLSQPGPEQTQGSGVQELVQIEYQLLQDCQLMRELIEQVSVLQQFIGKRFFEASEIRIIERRRQYQGWLGDLLERELDITIISRQLEILEFLIDAYQRLMRSLDYRRQASNER